MTNEPLAIRTGVDIVEINRIRQAMERHGAHFLRRIFSAKEIDWCQSRARPESSFAARFAAKEGVMKLLGVGIWEVGFCDIEVEREASGRPTVSLSGRAEEMASVLGVHSIALSLSHERTHAIASVVALIRIGS